MYSNPSNIAESLQRQSLQLDKIFFNPTPQANPEILKKAIHIGINYFSGFKGQKGIFLSHSKIMS